MNKHRTLIITLALASVLGAACTPEETAKVISDYAASQGGTADQQNVICFEDGSCKQITAAEWDGPIQDNP